MMLADARTLCPQIKVAPADPGGDLAFLETLALWAQRWGPWSAIDPPDGLLVDVSAVAHLFGGEAALLGDVARHMRRRGLTVRTAIAPTAGAAWALAHHGVDQAILPCSQAGQGEIPEMLARLPVAALRLDGDVVVTLRRLGLKKLSDLNGIERDSVQRRFFNKRSPAANPLLRMDQLLGLIPEPLLPVAAPCPPLVQRRLLEPIRHRALLDQVVADLSADMARELEGRGVGARRLELGLWRVDGDIALRQLEMAAPMRDPAHICRLFAHKLDDVEAGFGIEMLRMRAAWTETLHLSQRDLDAAGERHGTSLSACIDRLVVRLGEKAVRRPAPKVSHIPERAQAWMPPLIAAAPSQEEFTFHSRPLKLLDKAERIAVLYATPDGHPRQFRWRGAVHEVARVEGPERLAPEWWRERSTTRLRDYYRIEDALGRRYWIYRAGLIGDGRGGLPEWFLHGLCA
ncbi:Y-family DNA polymerase [Altererythrobacter sp. B11]|uniref:Y-family DNA polymerase n=1 Tax=Altererythrobacter sp. B11 TaxID=2060312 RepID=UPI001E2F2FAB|nr:DNA polymerase Y family protein [Altererythrobacter sp. B11]